MVTIYTSGTMYTFLIANTFYKFCLLMLVLSIIATILSVYIYKRLKFPFNLLQKLQEAARQPSDFLKFESVSSLRLPKHLKEIARADSAIFAKTIKHQPLSGVTDDKINPILIKSTMTTKTKSKKVHFGDSSISDLTTISK